MKAINKKRLAIFALVIALAIIFWSSAFLQNYFKEATLFLQNYGRSFPVLSVLVFMGLTTLSAMLMSFSSIWLVPVAVVLWNDNTTVFLLLVSWLVGATISYLIGFYGGHPIVKRLISEKKILYYEHLITNKFSFWVIFLFRLTLPSEIPGYLLGIARYNFPKYLLVTLLAEAPYAIYSVYAFESIVQKNEIMFISTLIVWFLTAWFVTLLYLKKVKKNT